VVTIADIVEQLSRYLISRKDKMLESKSPFLQITDEIKGGGEHVVGIPAYEDVLAPHDTKVAFEGFFGSIEAGNYALSVELWDDGEEGKALE
jgi:hypothetical protein